MSAGAKIVIQGTMTGGSGLNQLTGDVTAGPGAGSEAATLVATTNVKTIVAAWSAVKSVFGRTGAVVAVSGDYTAIQVPNVVVAVTQSATPAIDTDNGNIFSITGLAQAITSMTSGLTGTPVHGQDIRLEITDNGTARAITLGTSFAATTIALPTTTVAGKILRVQFTWDVVTSTWDCIGVA
jgi:hypothetical protein